MNTREKQEFDGQVAIVTGAAQGIGLVTSELLASRGAAVVMADVDADRLNTAAATLSGRGLDTTGHVVDLTDEDQVESLVDATIERHGQVDILVNLAAIYPYIPFDELTLAEWRKIMAANVDATFLCAQGVLPHMRQRNYGRIINTSSGTFQRPQPGLAAYGTSKGAVVGFTRQLAVEAGEGITVNLVMPGLIATDNTLSLLESEETPDAWWEMIIGNQAVKRRGEPIDVAHCVAYIAGRESSFITGQIFDVGGGVTYH